MFPLLCCPPSIAGPKAMDHGAVLAFTAYVSHGCFQQHQQQNSSSGASGTGSSTSGTSSNNTTEPTQTCSSNGTHSNSSTDSCSLNNQSSNSSNPCQLVGSHTWSPENATAATPTAIFYDTTKLPAKVAIAKGFYATGSIVLIESPLEALLTGKPKKVSVQRCWGYWMIKSRVLNE